MYNYSETPNEHGLYLVLSKGLFFICIVVELNSTCFYFKNVKQVAVFYNLHVFSMQINDLYYRIEVCNREVVYLKLHITHIVTTIMFMVTYPVID